MGESLCRLEVSGGGVEGGELLLAVGLAIGAGLAVGEEVGRPISACARSPEVGHRAGHHAGLGPAVGQWANPVEGEPLGQLGRVDAGEQLADGAAEERGQPKGEEPQRPASEFFSSSSTSAAVTLLIAIAALKIRCSATLFLVDRASMSSVRKSGKPCSSQAV